MSKTTIDLKKEVPDYILRVPDQESMINIFNVGANQICEDIDQVGIAHDFDRAESKYLELMLLEIAWTIKVEWTESQKRIIIKWNQKFFDEVGTSDGLAFAITKLFGIECIVTNATGQGSNQFIVGSSLLGGGDVLGDTSKSFTFIVQIPTVSVGVLSDITKLIDFLRWAPAQYEISQSL